MKQIQLLSLIALFIITSSNYCFSQNWGSFMKGFAEGMNKKDNFTENMKNQYELNKLIKEASKTLYLQIPVRDIKNNELNKTVALIKMDSDKYDYIWFYDPSIGFISTYYYNTPEMKSVLSAQNLYADMSETKYVDKRSERVILKALSKAGSIESFKYPYIQLDEDATLMTFDEAQEKREMLLKQKNDDKIKKESTLRILFIVLMTVFVLGAIMSRQ